MSASPRSRSWTIWLPLALFLAFIALVAIGLFRPADRNVASTLIERPLPEFVLPGSLPGTPGLRSAELKDGRPRLLNIFASWCIPCRVEAPQLAELKRSGAIVEGISVRDRPEAVQAFLAEHGNPFTRIGADNAGSVQLALGSSGVPETYVIDGRGRIRYQHIGEIRPEHVAMLLGKLEAAR
ncbi:cytochrome c biogenesis protein CcmG/thiol:disulfide interchange protein DsbE [Novosphingobium chloroacetimidivorans]|uniref:Cytochrome c biogenesis protein CcmG/thiol:disulfide interchange protein DsbE n=1 Tax=Novosphingobium chloroacetimidivorans TaxID=1428314 RepID=A0A7W7NWM1_9SPHN|nr:DsbE family thiol:disulfide interchange protein [Novosphingobium chloroacetimidivorans]MBB4858559.1 cytochrome c biogenesis protein CcmG/thiol:disulfide interchange protein DsbE [Novosphingobium chloroacetimidivorans]